MTILEIYAVVCLAASPATCETRTIPVHTDMTPYACAQLAQSEIAAVPLAPGHRIARYGCRRPEVRA